MGEPACRSCRHWQGEPNVTVGECRWAPPVVVAVSGSIERGVWPQTYPMDWCGRWSARGEPGSDRGLDDGRDLPSGDAPDDRP